MNTHLQTILDLIDSKPSMDEADYALISNAVREVDKTLSLAEFKLSRFNKESRTVSVILEETIDELQQKSTVLAQANTALTEAIQNLQSTQSQLVLTEKMAALGELTAGIAHEIQNPLNFVNNFSEVCIELVDELREALSQPETANDRANTDALLKDLSQSMKKINYHGKRADSIVRGMLEHARTSTGERQPTDLNALSDEYLRLAYHGLRAKNKEFNAQLITDFDPAIGLVDVVPQDMGRVLLNLFNNAFYAVREKQKTANQAYPPTVTVTTRRLKTTTEIRVRDNGTGIPDEVKEKIFQPFFTTKPAGQGTGLGLSLSHDIISAQGGTLMVKTQKGEGTEFIINLQI
ncbi:sensor histidine kinase [Spirosoma endophyticum]|uniref:histidine kinase n=1 Tax=Spirosoma endophyticum TaxID=662367 RepID=A0A1I1LLN4_9BACT|nr:ATP-binding protein [Spirosoma endophyticum]SFC73856.1 His Kinase A (phospho-acceptor) domain-containing protein [Spirosoma endophyticum]